MRPREVDITLRLFELHCTTTEDSGGDEPYLWILGFKVDAETMGPPPAGSILPALGVKVIEGMPASPFIVGTGEVNANDTRPVPPALGTRWMRLKPALLDIGEWFPGIAGIVCLLWDQDNFDPSTAEAGFRKLKTLFGPALSTELTSLINGGYDDDLAKDAQGNVTPDPPTGRTLAWRIARLRDAAGRRNVVKAVTRRVKDEIINRVKDAIKDAAGFDELLDPDDLLGVDAQIYLGDELKALQTFTLSFTDDEADYIVKGHAFGSAVHAARLDSTVTRLERVADRDRGLWRRVCWFDMKLYWAHSYRVLSTTTFELRALAGGTPTSVRWLLNDTLLPDGQGTIPVNFGRVDDFTGPPQDVLAPLYPGGPGTLTYRAAGSVLEISNNGGEGVFFGKVRALYTFSGDPSLFPPPATPLAALLNRGYELEAELGIEAVQIEMNEEYKEDVRRCMRTAKDIDLRHIELNFEKPKIGPGDPPPFRRELLDRVNSSVIVAKTVVVEGKAPFNKTQSPDVPRPK
jgi:hypothetical protein